MSVSTQWFAQPNEDRKFALSSDSKNYKFVSATGTFAYGYICRKEVPHCGNW